MTTAQTDKPSGLYKKFMGVDVMWPPECPDEILAGAIEETLRITKELEIAKDGQLIAERLKQYMDEKFDPYWHVFFGKNFGCHSVHVKNRFLYFMTEDKIAYLMYQSQ